MKTTLPLDEFPGANPLVRDYATSFDRVHSWFHYSPHDEDALADRIEELEGRPAADRGTAAEAVADQMRDWGAGRESLQAASQLGQQDTYVVVTGQQAGLFGGPLYTVLKALSAVKLARRLAQRFPGKNFVPTFWIASGDSDYDEVRSTSILARDGSLADLGLAPGGDTDESLVVGARNPGDAIHAQIQALGETLPGGEFRESVLEQVEKAYAGGTLVDGFARWMAQLFSGTELVLVDPQDPALMACATELIKKELVDSAGCEVALTTRNREIADRGYPLQVEHLEGDTNLFLLDGGGHREKISRTASGFELRPSGREITAEQLVRQAQDSPASFVCGVMLRPVYQNILFPPAAFIGGAAELAYRAQTTAVFDFHGEKMAPAFLRASATLLNPKQEQLLDELGWELTDCYTVPQDLTARAVEDLRPEKLEQSMQRYREVLAGADRELLEYAKELDPNLGKSFETLRENLSRHADKLEKKISGALKQRHAALVGQVERLHTAVYPELTVQERRLNILSFLPRHGLGLIQSLLGSIAFPAWEHQVITLD